MAETSTKENRITDLKKFFTSEGESLSIQQFKTEWDRLSEDEKDWFRKQSLE